MYLGMMIGLAACSSSQFTSLPVVKPQLPYHHVMTLFNYKQGDFRQLDSAFYNKYLRSDFNSLDMAKVRMDLEKRIKNNLEGIGTKITPSSDLYEVNHLYSFDEFKGTIDSNHFDAILFVNLDDWWTTSQKQIVSMSNGTHYVKTDEEPNGSYKCYLYDMRMGKIVWMGTSTVWGIYAGYDTINGKLSRNLRRKLRSEGYITKKDLVYHEQQ